MPDVLVVDDMSTDRLLAGGLLEEEADWNVAYANDGQAALDRVKHRPPDVIVTDLRMPELDGLELVRAVKQDFPSVPVVLMTSDGSEEIAVEALELGAASYVPKRILARELVRIVSRAYSAAQSGQSHLELMQHVNRIEHISIENNHALVSTLVSYLVQNICGFGICDQANGLQLSTALVEALANALFHGNLDLDSKLREDDDGGFYRLADERCLQQPYCDRRIHVTANFTPDEASISIRDEGLGFDPAGLPDPTDPEYICRPYGRGILLMRMFTDEVRYNSSGNEVTLVKRRNKVH